MFSGFDYGTSNCAMGIISPTQQANDTTTSKAQLKAQPRVQLLALEQNKAFMPSTLYALERELICEQVGLAIQPAELKQEFLTVSSSEIFLQKKIENFKKMKKFPQILQVFVFFLKFSIFFCKEIPLVLVFNYFRKT